MQHGERAESMHAGTPEQFRRLLREVTSGLEQHLSALSDAGIERLRADRDAYPGAAAARAIRIDVSIGPETVGDVPPVEALAADAGAGAVPDAGGPPYCMTVTQICGKGPTTYIVCKYTVCVDVISGAG